MSRLRSACPLTLGLALLVSLGGCSDSETNLPFTVVAQPKSPVTGPTSIFYTLTTDGSQAKVAVDVSLDDGFTFKKATEVTGLSNPILQTGKPEGTTQFFNWDPLPDLGPGVHRRVVIRVAGQGKDLGIFTQTGAFVVDLTDRLSTLATGEQPALTRPLALPLPDGTVWITGGQVPGGALNVQGYRYDPVSDTLAVTTPIATPRRRLGGALLTGGQALAVGGFDLAGAPLAQAESLRANDAGVQVVSEASLQVARGAPAVAPLQDGRALIVGGELAGGISTPVVESLTPGGATTAVALTDARLARREATATTLLDGRVLIAGGYDDAGAPVAQLALIDAAGATVSNASGLLGNPRAEHAAVRLPDGRVVLVGGSTRPGDDAAALSTAEVFDPVSATSTPLASMTHARRGPAAVYAGGEVVVFGGTGTSGAPTSAERLDLETLTWSAIAGPSGTSRGQAVAVASGNGRTIVVGGDQPPERYTPDTSLTAESFSALNVIPAPRADHTATLLPSGEVLLVGGTALVSSAIATVQVVDPKLEKISSRSALARPRARHAAALVGNELVVLGGLDDQGLIAEAEVFDTFQGRWRAAGTLNVPRLDPTATLLADGRVLVAGGTDASGNPVAQLETWTPQTLTFALAGTLTTARADHDAIRTGQGNALIGPGQGAAAVSGDLDLVVPGYPTPFRTSAGVARAGAALAELPPGSGLVWVSGGRDGSGNPRGDLDLLDTRVAPGVFLTQGRPLKLARSRHRAVVLANGASCLLVGGRNPQGGATDEHEVFALNGLGDLTTGTARWTLDRRGHRPRQRHTATRLLDGRVLIVGGADHRGVAIAGAEVYEP